MELFDVSSIPTMSRLGLLHKLNSIKDDLENTFGPLIKRSVHADIERRINAEVYRDTSLKAQKNGSTL